MTITRAELVDYCRRYAYSDHPVMPLTRKQIGRAIAHAEAAAVTDVTIHSAHPRLLTTCIDDVEQPLHGLSVLRTDRPVARRRRPVRRGRRLLRRIWRRHR